MSVDSEAEAVAGERWFSRYLNWRMARGFLLGIATALLLDLGVALYGAYGTTKAYREHPTSGQAYRIIHGTGFKNAVMRRLMIAPGTYLYDSEILEFFTREGALRDTLWNRHLLRILLDRIPDEDLVLDEGSVVGSVPFDLDYFGGRLMRIVRKTGLTEGVTNRIRGLSESGETQQLAADLLAAALKVTPQVPLRAETLEAIESNPFIDYGKLFAPGTPDPRWPQTYDEAEGLHAWPEHVPVPSEAANTLWRFAEKRFAPNDAAWTMFDTLCQHLVQAGGDTRNAVWSYITQHAAELPAAFLSRCTRQSKPEDAANVDTIFSRLRPEGDEARIDVFRTLASIDLPRAETRFKSLVAKADPVSQKDLIILLANQDSKLTAQYIDYAFQGATPPTVRFRTIASALYGPKVVDEYEALSHHRYFETGKSFPPTFVRGVPERDEAQRLQQLALKYRWFPGADDAMYRSAFAHLRGGNLAEAWKSIELAFTQELSDGDAHELLSFLAMTIAEETRARYVSFTVPNSLRAAWELGEAASMTRRALLDSRYSAAQCRADADRYAAEPVHTMLSLELSAVDLGALCRTLLTGRAQGVPIGVDNEDVNDRLGWLWRYPPERISAFVARVDRSRAAQSELRRLLKELMDMAKRNMAADTLERRGKLRYAAAYLHFFAQRLQMETNPPADFTAGGEATRPTGTPQSNAGEDEYAQTLAQLSYETEQTLKAARKKLPGVSDSFGPPENYRDERSSSEEDAESTSGDSYPSEISQ